MKSPIYLDYNATTPCDTEVVQAMAPYWQEHFGNAASNHAYGLIAKKAVEKARQQVCTLIGAKHPDHLIFTGSATEANNLAIKGCARMLLSKGKHLITQKTEHSSVLESFKYLEAEGFQVTYLDVDAQGQIDTKSLEGAIRPETLLVSIMAANNEIGTLQPIEEIGRICKEKDVLFHCDAVQAAGKVTLNVEKAQIDLTTLSGHKIYGPKGVGSLYVSPQKKTIRLKPLIHGGGHERGFRSGTLAIPLIVGMGEATLLAQKDLTRDQKMFTELRNRFWHKLSEALPHINLNGHPKETILNTLNISFEYVDGEMLLMGLTGLALSSGSACHAAKTEPSHVLAALGVSSTLAQSSIRFSLGRPTTSAEIDDASNQIINQVKRLRNLSDAYQTKQKTAAGGTSSC